MYTLSATMWCAACLSASCRVTRRGEQYLTEWFQNFYQNFRPRQDPRPQPPNPKPNTLNLTLSADLELLNPNSERGARGYLLAQIYTYPYSIIWQEKTHSVKEHYMAVKYIY